LHTLLREHAVGVVSCFDFARCPFTLATRRIARLWRTARDAGGRGPSHASDGAVVLHHESFAPAPVAKQPKRKADRVPERAALLLRVEVLTIFEAYVDMLRDIGPAADEQPEAVYGPTAAAPPAPTVELYRLAPFIDRLESVSMSINAAAVARDDAAVLTELERIAQDLQELSRQGIPRLRSSDDGRFSGWQLNGVELARLERSLVSHLSFTDKRLAGMIATEVRDRLPRAPHNHARKHTHTHMHASTHTHTRTHTHIHAHTHTHTHHDHSSTYPQSTHVPNTRAIFSLGPTGAR
jgi:hypothetical protein